ncbi:MAG: Asp-tRNA(Asn)/Glu-tRNA(Gln) amidotransferase subunit GatB [Ferruginibacter sp.]
MRIFAAVNTTSKYQAVIGLEVHTQLLTKSKLFCGDSTAFGADANTQVSPVSLAHPGTLPVMNKEVIELALKLGIALNCTIVQHNYFARKNYFYPDLPKAYQVSQHTAPVCLGGYLKIGIGEGEKKILLNRIHMEEDAGKSIHDIDENHTSIDLNRAGSPLLEIVTEPCIHSADEAYAYLTELRRLVRWLGVCDGNMEEGSMRCDANISIRLQGETKLGTRVEVKNLNSIRNVKRAIEYEIQRLIEITEKGEKIIQQTRSFDADKGTTFSLRTKEDAEDYRYFPEPDLPPFYISDKRLAAVKETMPALPEELQKKYCSVYQLSAYDANLICADKEDAAFFEAIITHTDKYKAAANWMIGPVKSYCHEKRISLADFPLTTRAIADLVELVETGKVNFNTAAHKVMQRMIDNPGHTAMETAMALNLLQEHDGNAIEEWVTTALHNLPEKVKEYKSGKKGLIGLFAGEVKKLSKGKADMQLVNKLLLEKLK